MHLNLHPGAPQFLQSFGLWRTSDMSRGREAMAEAMLATPETAAAATWSVLQRGAEGRMCWAYGGPEIRQGTIASPSWIPCLWGGSRFKRSRAMLEGAGSMRRLGDVSGNAACAGGRWMALRKG